MRTFRTRTTAAAATALLAALSLTACQNGEGSAAAPATAAPAPAGAASPAGTAQPGTAGGRTDSPTTPGDTGNSGHTGTGKEGGRTGDSTKPAPKPAASPAGNGTSTDPASFVTCTGGTTKVTVTRPSRPINHLLITATNTGSRTCLAYAAPLLRFDDEQATPRLVDSSKPQAVVTLAPGESAYAGVILSGERAPEEANGRVTRRLSVLFDSRDGSGSVGSPATVTLPADTYKTDDAAVTYWQSGLDDALMY
ncbi:DUF4232 domain-containing protein [Streptomyces sp. enrichment culture]|uniref:DUF4232 domain-containing protein n=1 Tax=Streptomyces sp. enrichment culture TaxID=1795815 RepID=UPI003F57AF5B